MISKIRFKPIAIILRNMFSTDAKSSNLIKSEKEGTKLVSTKFQYIDNELVPVINLVLSTRQNMEEYVLKIINEYFRTTQRAKLHINSNLSDHGLDSLDLIEIAMQVENDLGYMISAENLPAFSKPIHFVNHIEQVENYKRVYGASPMP